MSIPNSEQKADVAVIGGNGMAAVVEAVRLRRKGIAVWTDLSGASLRKQHRRATRMARRIRNLDREMEGAAALYAEQAPIFHAEFEG